MSRFNRLQKTNKNSREIEELIMQQTNDNVEIYKTLQQNPQDLKFYKCLIICDEKWVHLRGSVNRKTWSDVGSQPNLLQNKSALKNSL